MKNTIHILLMVLVFVFLLVSTSLFSVVNYIPSSAIPAVLLDCDNGDLATVNINGVEETVRLAGVDVENYYCSWIYRREGSFWIEYIHTEHSGNVLVTFDRRMPRDSEGHRLVYIYFGDRYMLNQEFIMGGYTGANLTDNYSGRSNARAWQRWAQHNGRGMWNFYNNANMEIFDEVDEELIQEEEEDLFQGFRERVQEEQ